jgi:hypothetical protein
MPGVPFMQYPFPRKPDPQVAPSPAVPATQAGSRAGVLGASLHAPKETFSVGDAVQLPDGRDIVIAAVTSSDEPTEKQKLIDYCVSAGVSIDKRWGIEKIKAAIESHKAP